MDRTDILSIEQTRETNTFLILEATIAHNERVANRSWLDSVDKEEEEEEMSKFETPVPEVKRRERRKGGEGG